MDKANMSEDLKPDTIIRWITAIFITAVLILLAVFLYSARIFSKTAPPQDLRAAFGQFGDFVGGTTNPILALLTLTGLLLTILLQVKQLQNSKHELEETRALVVQSNHAREYAASELAKQALASRQTSDLEAVKLLLVQYRSDLKQLESKDLVASDPRRQRIDQLRHRETSLLIYIDSVYDRILPNPSQLE